MPPPFTTLLTDEGDEKAMLPRGERTRALLVGILMVTAFILGVAVYRAVSNGGDMRGSIVVDGLVRTYLLHLPPWYNGTQSLPLVIALHGGGGTADSMVKLTRGGLNELADERGFIVVYPNAVERHWNDGRNLSVYRSQRENVNDVAFISALIEHLADEYGVDQTRVYVVGMSNGALMAHRLACEIPSRIAAIAAVAGSMPVNLVSACPPSSRVSVMMINGLSDPLVPWGGGPIRFGDMELGEVISVEEAALLWAGRGNCTLICDRVYLPDTDPHDGTRVWKRVFKNNTTGVEVVLYGVDGGGHTWPGGYQYLPESIIGKTCRDVDANEIIWEFFQRHTLIQNITM